VHDGTFKSSQSHVVRSKNHFSRDLHQKTSFFKGNVAIHFFFVTQLMSQFIFFPLLMCLMCLDVFDVFDLFDDIVFDVFDAVDAL